jgi:methylamine dehydrogenase heavy chain
VARVGAPRHAVLAFSLLLVASVATGATAADFVAEQATTGSLADGRHRVWLHDLMGIGYSKAALFDADTGRQLAQIDTGYLGMELELPAHAKRFYSAETYLSRGFRGTRTDVVTTFDATTLLPTGEIEIPAKRLLGMPTSAHASLLDDERFLLAYNFSPASTVSVVDLERGAFVGEIELAGCALIYPLGPRRFASLCGDGSLLEVTLDDAGQEQARKTHAKLFDPTVDPLLEKAVRAGAQWLFVSFAGDVHPVDVSDAGVAFGATWPLADAAERSAGWLPGGLQPFAVHASSGRLYALMHLGGADTHKDPGQVVWVYDLKTKKRVQKIALGEPATSIAVSQDDAPLLYAAFLGAPRLVVYDARSGAKRRTIENAASWPGLVQPIAGAAR